MQITLELPLAFSVRDDHEISIIQDLVQRIDARLVVILAATGMHKSGGATVNWGVIHLAGPVPGESLIQAALQKAGFDARHNIAIDAPQYGTTINST